MDIRWMRPNDWARITGLTVLAVCAVFWALVFFALPIFLQ